MSKPKKHKEDVVEEFLKPNEPPKPQIARGDVIDVKDSYYEYTMKSFRGNPLIEAIRPLGTQEECIADLVTPPDWEKSYQSAPNHERALMPAHLKNYFMPSQRHYGLAQGIFQLIQLGYTGRNPLSADWNETRDALRKRAARKGNLSAEQVKSFGEYLPDQIETALVTGMSGLGKSISVARILQKCIPQVLVHTSYKGKPFPRIQIPWVYISCPYNGQALQLSSLFLKEVDMAVQRTGRPSNIHDDHIKQHTTGVSSFSGVFDVALESHVGLVVIDEIQNLTAQGLGSGGLLLNFIVQLQNTLGVPVLLIGNGSAHYLTAESFRMVRRTSFLRDPHWGRMKKNSNEWNAFLKALWVYQYLEKSTPLDQGLSDAMYERTAGIPDVVGDLFRFVQERAINERLERITPESIMAEAERSLPRKTKILVEAIHEHDWSTLGLFEDLHITDFEADGVSKQELETGGHLMAQSRKWLAREVKKRKIKGGMRVPGSGGS